MGYRERVLSTQDFERFGERPYPIVNKGLVSIGGFLVGSKVGFWIAPLEAKFGREPLKKLFLLACLIVLVAPYSAFAGRQRRHIRAHEMAGMGVGAAALVGAAGYLLLRRRHSA